MKKHRVLRNLILDILCAGIALVVFALFHHVLPRQQQGLGIVIENPYAAPSSREGDDAPELHANLLASALGTDAKTFTVSDAGKSMLSGRSSRSTKNVMSQKGGSGLTEEEEAENEQTAEEIPLWEKFEEKYTDETVRTENSYSSPDISITVSQHTLDNGRITYYLADIYLRDVTSFQTALARNTYGSGYRDDIASMAALSGALVAVNGDYYGNTNEGVVIRNGVIYRANRTDCDVCVLYYDGSMRVMPGASFSVEEAIRDGAWQAWTFGPALLDGAGEAISSFSSTNRIIAANPRTAIGYYEPGHYCLVVVDGRGDSAGITLPRLSQLFEELGCQAAYNLDGGNSSIMVWNGDVINDPSGGGRESSDALLIAEVKGNE